MPLCDRCQTPYKPTRPNRRFCSTACRVAAFQLRHGLRRLPATERRLPTRRERIEAAAAALRDTA